MNGRMPMGARVALAISVLLATGLVFDTLYPDMQILYASTMGVALFAAGSIIWTRRAAQQQETLNFIQDYNSNPAIARGFSVMYRVADGYLTIEKALERIGKERGNFLVAVNKFEILAIGLNHQLYDRRMINDFFGRDIVDFYRSAEYLIEYYRSTEPNPKAFKNFEKLAEQMGKPPR